MSVIEKHLLFDDPREWVDRNVRALGELAGRADAYARLFSESPMHAMTRLTFAARVSPQFDMQFEVNLKELYALLLAALMDARHDPARMESIVAWIEEMGAAGCRIKSVMEDLVADDAEPKPVVIVRPPDGTEN